MFTVLPMFIKVIGDMAIKIMDLVNTASFQKYSPKMADVIESYSVAVFIFVSLLLFCSHFCYFETIPVITDIYIIDDVMLLSAENYYFVFFLV